MEDFLLQKRGLNLRPEISVDTLVVGVIAWLTPGFNHLFAKITFIGAVGEFGGVRGSLTFLRFSLLLQRFSECSQIPHQALYPPCLV